jgi:hypothetical protein
MKDLIGRILEILASNISLNPSEWNFNKSASEIESLIKENYVEKETLNNAINELFKLFDENIIVRNTDNDYDFARFTNEGLRITETLQKFDNIKDK